MAKLLGFLAVFSLIGLYAGDLEAGVQNKFFFEMQTQYDEFNENLFRKIQMSYYLRGNYGKSKFDLNASYFEGDVKEEFSDISRFNISKNFITGLNFKRGISDTLTLEASTQQTIGSIRNNTPGYYQPEAKLKLTQGVNDSMYISLFSGYTYKYLPAGPAEQGEYSKTDAGVNIWYYAGMAMNVDFTYDIFYRNKPYKNMFAFTNSGDLRQTEETERELTHYQQLNLSGNLWNSLNYYFSAQHAYADLTANYVYEDNNTDYLEDVIDGYYNLHWFAYEFYTLYSYGRKFQLMLWSMMSMENYLRRPAYNSLLEEKDSLRAIRDIMGSFRMTYNLTGFTSIFFEYTYSTRKDNDTSVPWNEYSDNTYTAGLRIYN